MKTYPFLPVLLCYNTIIEEGAGAIPRLFIMHLKGGRIVNARRLMYKLQTALCARGIRVRINLRQSWMERDGRSLAVTKYIVVDDDTYHTIIETYKAVEVVKALAELLVGGDDE